MKENKRGVDLLERRVWGGRQLGRVEGGKTEVGMKFKNEEKRKRERSLCIIPLCPILKKRKEARDK